MTVSTVRTETEPVIVSVMARTIPHTLEAADGEHIRAIVLATDTLPERVLVPGVDYASSLIDDVGPGGAAILTVAAAQLYEGRDIILRRSTPITQGVALPNQGPYFARTIERALDRGMLVSQEIKSVADKLEQEAERTSDIYDRVDAVLELGKGEPGEPGRDGLLVLADTTALIAYAGAAEFIAFRDGSLWFTDGTTDNGVTDANGFLTVLAADGRLWTRRLADYVTPQMFGGTDSAAVKAAIASGYDVHFEKVVGPNMDTSYDLSGTAALSSGQTLAGIGKPTLRITTSGEERGLWFPPGCDGAEIVGAFDVTYTCLDGAPGGDFATAIGMGQFVYDTDTPEAVRNCKMLADISMTLVGPQNGNAFNCYGYVEDCEVNLPDIADTQFTGDITNFAWPFHWGHNNAADRQGVPTKTWHVHRVVIHSANLGAGTAILRALRLSGVGDVTVNGLDISDVNEAISVFLGDFGYQFAQNLPADFKPQIKFTGTCRTRNCANFHLSVDGQTSNKGGTPTSYVGFIVTGELDAANTTPGVKGDLLAVSHADTINMRIVGRDDDLSSNASAVGIFGALHADLDLDLRSPEGVLVRGSGSARIRGVNTYAAHPVRPTGGRYGVSASSTVKVTTTVGAAAAGDTAITINNPALATGYGGFLQYDDGSELHDIELFTPTNTFEPTQQVSCAALPVAIPDDATVSIVQTVKSLAVRADLVGWDVSVRTTGGDKIRSLDVSGSAFADSGIYDVDAGQADNFRAIGYQTDGGGYGNANAYGMRLNNTVGYNIGPATIGPRTTFRYDVYADNDSNGGVIAGIVSSNPDAVAVVFYDADGGAENVEFGSVVSTTGRPTGVPAAAAPPAAVPYVRGKALTADLTLGTAGTPPAIPSFTHQLVENKLYRFDLILYHSDDAGDAGRLGFSAPIGSRVQFFSDLRADASPVRDDSGDTDDSDGRDLTVYDFPVSTAAKGAYSAQGTVRTGATAGPFMFHMSYPQGDGTPGKLFADSCLTLTEIVT